jgi:PAS domain S-box-containing protein
MTEQAPTSPIARLAAALAQPQPEATLAEALNIAREHGIAPTQPGQEPCFTLVHETRSLMLSAGSGPLPGAELWSSLLQAAFTRTAEHERFLRAQQHADLLSAASFEGLVFHMEGWTFDVNTRFLEMVGFERSELLGEQLLQRCIAPEDIPTALGRMRDGYQGEYVIWALRKDGSRYRAELQAKQGKLGDRSVRVVAVRDVTERERAQGLLRESELRLRHLMETSFDLTVLSRDGVALDVVGPLERLLGYTREQIIGKKVFEYVPENARQEVVEAHAGARVGSYESALLSAHGEAVPVEVVAVNTTLHGEPVRMTAMRDLRELKREQRERRELERAFEQSQRLESLGVLAGGIAHDFNNLLTVVLGHAEILQQRLDAATDQELVRGIVEAAQGAAGLTAQMLAYAGRSELGPRTPVDLALIVQELRPLLDAGLSKRAQITLSFAQQCVVLGNRATLTQVIMNLLTNASDALRDGAGGIAVRTSRVSTPDARWSRALGGKVSAGRWVLLEVSDTGTGMDEATRVRIFEPFFSTKTTGHGLGLAACVGIVASHGGAILVESQLGRGSTFSVLLPEFDAVPPATKTDSWAGQAAGHTVLVVDDEPAIRAYLRTALTMQGHEVVVAENGSSALASIERAEPSLVLLDMTMPDLSGVEVLRRIRAAGRRVPVVFSSGYHDAALELDPESFQGFLVKPYRLQELYAVLARALSRS